MEKTVSVNTESESVKLAVITQENRIQTKPVEQNNLQIKSKINMPRQSKTRFNAHSTHEANNETDAAISFINNADLGWKADVCKLQKHHAEYGAHCDQPQELVQLQEDVSRKGKQFGVNNQDFQKALLKAQDWSQKYSTADEIPDNMIPESYDMRDIDGFDFTNPLRDQGSCGSCYTVSFTQVVESRLKLKYGQKIPVMSP